MQPEYWNMKIMNIQSCSCPEATTGCIPGILLPLAHVATVRRSHGSNGASGPGEIWQMEPLAYRLTKIWGLMVGPSAYQPISYNISNISCVSFLHLVGQESLAEREMFQSLRSPQGSPNSFADLCWISIATPQEDDKISYRARKSVLEDERKISQGTESEIIFDPQDDHNGSGHFCLHRLGCHVGHLWLWQRVLDFKAEQLSTEIQQGERIVME